MLESKGLSILWLLFEPKIVFTSRSVSYLTDYRDDHLLEE